MHPYTTIELQRASGGKVTGSVKNTFSVISTDSRSIPDPSETVFFALEGNNRNGHTFVNELLRKGVKLFVVKNCFLPSTDDPSVTFIHVKDTLQALQDFSSYVRSLYKGTVIGITGSNGKTIVKEWIYQVFRGHSSIFRSPRSYNSQVGVPLSLSLLEDHCEISVIEAGISQPGEMVKLERIIKPDIGILTNIGDAHQENFRGYSEKLKEKLILFIGCKKLIYCCDHELVNAGINEVLPPSVKRVTWGSSPESDYQIMETTREDKFTGIKIRGLKEVFRIPFTDSASVENALHVLVLGLSQGMSPGLMLTSLQRLEPVEMRMEILKGVNSCILVSDSYNSDIRSVEIALDLLMQQNLNKKKTVILSDIYQSGKTGKDLYSAVAELINRKSINIFIGIGHEIAKYKDLFRPKTFFYHGIDDFIRSGIWSSFRNESILIKGSRSFEFEKITRLLQEKSHETILEINLTSLVSNYNIYRSMLTPGTRLMIMVKAFSYGSGSYEIAGKLQFHKADYVATAFTDEGVELRKNGISLPVMVMNPSPSSFWTIVEYKLEPEIYNRRILDEFMEFADKNGLVSYPVHIKLDTGMHRLGFGKDDLYTLLEKIPSPLLDIVSVFSHPASAEDPENDGFTRRQIDLYIEMCDEIYKRTGKKFIRHLMNSAGIARFPEAHFDMVRMGIGLYGVDASGKLALKEVSTLKTHISQIRQVAGGEGIGYGLNGRSELTRTIAVIPVGYADGIPRSLGNGNGKFMVNSHFAPVTGNVCMDMCMLDITGVEAKEGDEVIIFGPGHSVSEIAKAANTIPYEILTGIPERVKRVYLEE